MADFADLASDQEAANLKQALANFDNHRRRQTESFTECSYCDEPIPEARRLAVPGCVLCVSCQEKEEKGMGLWG